MVALISKKICIIGLGYVGLPLLEEFSKVSDVIGYDVDQDRIREVKRKFKNHNQKSKIQLFSNIDDLPSTQVYIITVPTPIDKHNKPNLEPLISSSKTVGSVIKKCYQKERYNYIRIHCVSWCYRRCVRERIGKIRQD